MGLNIGFSRLSNANQDKRTKSGLLYHWKYTAPSRNSNVAYAKISIATQSLCDVRFQREGFGSRLAKWLGFTREFQTGDTEFDKTIFIDSDEPAIGNALGMDARLRGVILKLFSFGIYDVRVSKGMLIASMKKKHPLFSFAGGNRDALDFVNEVVAPMMWQNSPPMLAEDTLDALVSALMELEGKLPKPSSSMTMSMEDSQSSVYRRRARALNIAIVMLLGLGLPVFIYDRVAMPPLAYYTPFTKDILQFAAVGLVGFWFIVYALLRGSVRGFDVLKTLLVFGVLGIGFSTAVVLYHVDVQLDNSPRELHEQRVLEKHITTSHSRKSGTSYHYHVIVQGWHTGERTYDMTVSRDQYDLFNQGGIAHIATHKGHLGYEWIESFN